MASTYSKHASKKTKLSSNTSNPPIPESYEIFGITKETWEKCHSVRYRTERSLVELYNNCIKRLEEQNKQDQHIIMAHQNKVDLWNQEIEETRQKNFDVYKDIENSLYIS